MAQPKTIAIVTCSNRARRLNPYVTDYVHEVLLAANAKRAEDDEHITFQLIDIAAQNLPLYDEPAVPSHLDAAAPVYAHAHTRAWSAVVRPCAAFIFVTPQYNWSVPAALKNALDYLYHEWGGKPAGVVSYGARGGGKGAAHLRDILGGLRMRVVPTAVALTAKGEDLIEQCEEAGGRVTRALRKAWKDSGAEEAIGIMLGDVIEILSQ